MSQHAMDMEDYYFQAKAQIAAQEEQIDNLVAMLRVRDEELGKAKEQISRLTVALDDALGIIRAREVVDKALKAEAEALEL